MHIICTKSILSTMYGWIISAAALPVVVVATSFTLLCALLLYRCVVVAAVKGEDTNDELTTSFYPIANNDNRVPSPIISSATIKTEEIDTDNEDENIDNNNNNRVPINNNRTSSPITSAAAVKSEAHSASSPIICCWNEAHHLRIGFFGELIKFIEYDIKEEIREMLEETIKENPYLLEMTCPVDVLDNEREVYLDLTAVECCCRYPTYDSTLSVLYLLQKLIWLGAKSTYRCYLYIMNNDRPEEEQLEYFVVLLQSGYFPLMIEYESKQVFTLDYIIGLLPCKMDIKEDPNILTILTILYKLVGLGDDFLFSEYQEERKTLVANNKQLPPLRTKGRRKTHSKNGPLDKLLKKYSVDDVWNEWEKSVCNCNDG